MDGWEIVREDAYRSRNLVPTPLDGSTQQTHPYKTDHFSTQPPRTQIKITHYIITTASLTSAPLSYLLLIFLTETQGLPLRSIDKVRATDEIRQRVPDASGAANGHDHLLVVVVHDDRVARIVHLTARTRRRLGTRTTRLLLRGLCAALEVVEGDNIGNAAFGRALSTSSAMLPARPLIDPNMIIFCLHDYTRMRNKYCILQVIACMKHCSILSPRRQGSEG